MPAISISCAARVPLHALYFRQDPNHKKTLRENASSRHVPAVIMAVPDIPYTFSAKKVESSVTNSVDGRPVSNRDFLTNPESLDFFEGLLPQLREE